MEKDTFRQRLLAIVLPVALQQLLTSLVGASDALMLGMLDQASLSAVSLATQVQFVLSLFVYPFTMGATMLAAQYWGKHDAETVAQVQGIALRCSMVISTLFFLAALCIPEMLMLLFTNDTALVALGVPYLRIVSFSYLCSGWTQIVLCIMKNSGRVVRSTVYSVTAMVGNLILNTILIFGMLGAPAMGIRGAALATSISQFVVLVLVMLENRRPGVIKLRWHDLVHPPKRLHRTFWKHTLPMLLNNLSWGFGFTMTSVIMGHLGSDAVAASAMAQIVRNVAECVCSGIAAGAGILVGNELGAGHLEQARRYGGKLCRLSIVAGAISGGVILCFSPLILRYAGSLSSQAHSYLRFMLIVCSYYLIGRSLNSTIINGIFSAGGDTVFGLKCDTINMWLVIVPMGLLAAFVLKLSVPVVYFLLNLDEFTKIPAEWLHYRKYKWVRNLTVDAKEEAA